MSKPCMMMDSGAYSAWTRKQPVDIARYCDFLHENLDWIDHYVGLDFIGPGDTQHAARQGFNNWKYMQGRGLGDAIPVVHQGESFDWIHRYLDAGARYIGLALTSLAAKHVFDQWYGEAWQHLINKDGLPIARVHAFGDTREFVMRRYPWASCDSSSWVYSSQRYGKIRIDDQIDPLPLFRQITEISQRNDGGAWSGAMPDIDHLPNAAAPHKGERKTIQALLAEHGLRDDVFDQRPELRNGSFLGFRRTGEDRDHANRTLLARSFLTIKAYQSMEARAAALFPRRFKFGVPLNEPFVIPDVPVDPAYQGFSLFLAIGLNHMALPLLYAADYRNILASYFYLIGSDANKRRLAHVKQYMYDQQAAVNAPGPHHKYTVLFGNIIREGQDEGNRAVQETSAVQPNVQQTRA